MTHRWITRPATLTVALLAVGASTAVAQPQDLRSPDAQGTTGPDAARVQPADLRSPDTRDAAANRGTFSAPEVLVVKVPQSSSSGGIDWNDAGLGAGGVLGLTVLALGGTVAVLHRRHGRPLRRSTASSG